MFFLHPVWTKRALQAAGLLVGAFAVVVLIGWHIHSIPLIQVLPTLAPMQRMTAVGFVLCGFALVFAGTEHTRPVLICGLLVFFLSLLVCLEYVLATDFGMDELLGRDYINVKTLNPGRMSPVTALCFLGSSLALLAIAARRSLQRASAIVGLLASTLIAVGIVSLAGYLLGRTEIYGWIQFSRMALHTSGAFALTGAALMLWAWREGQKKGGSPAWLPASLGLGLAAAALGIWQALMKHEEGELPLLSNLILGGSLLGSLLVAIAVAEAQKARQHGRDLRTTNRMLQQLFDIAPDGLVMVNEQGVILRVNEQAEKIFGYARNQLVGQPIENLVPERIRQQHGTHRKNYHASPGRRPMGQGMELQARRQDGSEFPVEIALTPVQFADETLAVAVVRDITERRQAEAALRQSEERFRSIFEQGSIGVALMDQAGRIVSANPAFCRMLGYSQTEITTLTPIDITYADDLDPTRDLVRSLFTGGISVSKIEKRYVKKNGELLWAALSASVIHDHEGRRWYGLGMVQDISDRKRMEAEIEANKEQLVASARLSALGMMAGGIAHEINNPLAIIHALASDLADTVQEEGAAPAEMVARNSRRIRETADRIARIVKSLRHISREGSSDKAQPARIVKIMEDTLEICREKFRANAIEFLLPPSIPELTIYCREVQISQVLLNLLQNAFDAVMEQPGERWVRLEVEARDASAVISVTDSGPGIPTELRSRIMEPFFTTKPVGQGTGLGLSLSKTIAEEHGGRLQYTEKEGHTCFSVTLPLAGKANVHEYQASIHSAGR